MPKLGFSDTSDYTCALFRELDARGRYRYEELARLCEEAPSGPLTGVWMSHHTLPLTQFPRLYPVAVVDDGTDVFVRSLPGTMRQLTMKLSFRYELELSGPVAIHLPGEAPSWDRTKVFHEHVRFPGPRRHEERLRCLKGEWIRADLLAFETRRRAGVPERSGREWWLRRCTTSLDRAVLDQYVDADVTHEPAAAAGPVLPPTPLDEALSRLLYTDSGAAWHAAARQAARLLAPLGSEREDREGDLEGLECAQERLACLALIIQTLADESLTAPAAVPISEIRNILSQGLEQIEHRDDAEPQRLKRRIGDALDRCGHGAIRADDASVTIPPVYRLYVSRSKEDWHVRQNRPYPPAGQSDLARVLPWLARRLSRPDSAEPGPARRPSR